MAGEFFTGVDAAWLRMDRPGNLAQIAGVMIFDTPIDRARLIEVVHERLLIYDRFRQHVREPILGLGLPRWEFDANLDLNYHLPQVSLPAPAGQLELQRLVGDLMGQPLDRAHPLWRFYIGGLSGRVRAGAGVASLHCRWPGLGPGASSDDRPTARGKCVPAAGLIRSSCRESIACGAVPPARAVDRFHYLTRAHGGARSAARGVGTIARDTGCQPGRVGCDGRRQIAVDQS
jgi:hypothetical protein